MRYCRACGSKMHIKYEFAETWCTVISGLPSCYGTPFAKFNEKDGKRQFVRVWVCNGKKKKKTMWFWFRECNTKEFIELTTKSSGH